MTKLSEEIKRREIALLKEKIGLLVDSLSKTRALREIFISNIDYADASARFINANVFLLGQTYCKLLQVEGEIESG